MAGTGWTLAACALVLVATFGCVLWQHRAVTQALHNCQGAITGLGLDLDAARERIGELQSYLSDHDTWQAHDSPPVPVHLIDPAVPDRWSTQTPSIHTDA